jgi:hypothetical protein
MKAALARLAFFLDPLWRIPGEGDRHLDGIEPICGRKEHREAHGCWKRLALLGFLLLRLRLVRLNVVTNAKLVVSFFALLVALGN